MPTQKDPSIFGYQNFYSTTLTGDITSGTLTIGLATVPTPTSGILVIEPDSTTNREVILYTSKGASTITCPSDGRGWSGSTAAAHLTGSTVIMGPVDEWFEGLADGTLSADPLRTVLNAGQDFVVSGGVIAQSSGLIGTFSNIVFYLAGRRFSGTSIANKTYTASKDTYVDVTGGSDGTVTVTYSEVANGAAAPTLAANYVRIGKVITNGSAITVVQQHYIDSLGNIIYPQAAGTKRTDANGWTEFNCGKYREYRKRVTFSQSIGGLVALATSSSNLPYGMGSFSQAHMNYSFVAGGQAGILQIVQEGSSGSSSLNWTTARTDGAAASTFTGYIDVLITTV